MEIMSDKKAILGMITELIAIIQDNEYPVIVDNALKHKVMLDPIVVGKMEHFDGDIWELINLIGCDVYYVAGTSITNAAEIVFSIFNTERDPGFRLMTRGW